jgi:hypothetical protein
VCPVKFGTGFAVFSIPLVLIGMVFLSSATVRRDCFAGIGPTGQKWYARWSGRTVACIVWIAIFALWVRLTFGWSSAAHWLTEKGLGEPISVFEGVSIWPTIALRAVAFLLAMLFIWYTVHALEVNRQETRQRFNEWSGRESSYNSWNDQLTKGGWTAVICALRPLPPRSSAEIDQREDDPRDEKPLSDIVNDSPNHWTARCVRAGLNTALMFLLLYVILAPLSDPPPILGRGSRAQSIYWWISLSDFLAALYLTFLVADATIYSRAFVGRLTAPPYPVRAGRAPLI